MKQLISSLPLAVALAGVLTTAGAPIATGAPAVSPAAFTSSDAVPAVAKSTAMTSMVQAKGGCLPGGICGTVYNGTNMTVKVAMGWCESRKGPCADKEIKELKPHKSTHGWGDVDGYLVPDGYTFNVEHNHGSNHSHEKAGPGWHKIDSADVADIQSSTH